MRKTSKILCCLPMLICILLVGFGSGAWADAKKITFWKAPHSDQEAVYWKPILEKFMKENPGITVEHLVTPWDTWTEKYTAAFAGGNPPDVSYMTEWYPTFAEANQLADLSTYVSADTTKSIGKGNWDYATYKGKLIGIPFLAVDSIVFYNKDIFAKEGLSIPKTWDEFLAVAKKLTKDTNGDGKIDQWGTAFGLKPEINIHQFMPFVIAAGQSYLTPDEKQLGFANPDGIKAIKYITDFIVKEKVAPTIDMETDQNWASNLFYSGKIAMVIGQNIFESDVKTNAPNLKLGAFELPAGPVKDPRVARANYGGLGLLSMAQASKNKDLAWKLIDFIMRPENASMYLAKVNFLSPVQSANKIMYPSDEIINVASAATQSMVNYPVNPKWKEIDTTLKLMLEEIIRGAKPADKAVMDANEKAKAILK